MEWSMPLNDMLIDFITKIDYTLIPPDFQGDVRTIRAVQDSMAKVIDVIGEQSAAAQGLNRVITTAEKLRNSPSHTLYLMKDSTGKDGAGEVIGMLKVGHKHLFLFDLKDQVHEVEPLCVLDFYVVQNRQRCGYGRRLFDFMLHDKEMNPHNLAIDGPSSKMEQFLAKAYGVDKLLRQNNNFAVSPEFFENLPASGSKPGSSAPAVAAAVGRFAAPKPHSAIATVIHGGASYYAETNNGDSSEREVQREEEHGDGANYGHNYEQEDELDEESPLSDDERVPEPQPPSDSPEDWDNDELATEYRARLAQMQLNEAGSERPRTLPVEPDAAAAPPAAPAAFADVPAAGLPSGANTPASAAGSGAGAGARRDSQLTDKGYFDVKFYHNRLW